MSDSLRTDPRPPRPNVCAGCDRLNYNDGALCASCKPNVVGQLPLPSGTRHPSPYA